MHWNFSVGPRNNNEHRRFGPTAPGVFFLIGRLCLCPERGLGSSLLLACASVRPSFSTARATTAAACRGARYPLH